MTSYDCETTHWPQGAAILTEKSQDGRTEGSDPIYWPPLCGAHLAHGSPKASTGIAAGQVERTAAPGGSGACPRFLLGGAMVATQQGLPGSSEPLHWSVVRVPASPLGDSPASERISPQESRGSPSSITVGKDGRMPGWVWGVPRTPCQGLRCLPPLPRPPSGRMHLGPQ